MPFLAELTWPEAEQAFASCNLAILPVGSQEQHGPHIATSCDAVRAGAFARLLEQRLSPKALVLPTLTYGISPHHMSFPGTITLQPSTLLSMIEDIGVCLRHHGLLRCFLLNAHGGNQSILNVAVEQLKRIGVVAATCNYTSMAKDVIRERIDSPITGHACEREASELMVLCPDILRRDLLDKVSTEISFPAYTELNHPYRIIAPLDFRKCTTSGFLGNPGRASEELGKAIIDRCLDRLEEFCREFANMDL